jgi:ATP-dependent RNA helicase DHX37/DHR1
LFDLSSHLCLFLSCRYVVDAGRSKQKLLEAHSGAAVARYTVDWVSKAAAEQRAGRAGRTGPGHVYRLFSSAHFNDNFKQHSDPEIVNTPLEGVVLLLKAMGVDKVRAVLALSFLISV